MENFEPAYLRRADNQRFFWRRFTKPVLGVLGALGVTLIGPYILEKYHKSFVSLSDFAQSDLHTAQKFKDISGKGSFTFKKDRLTIRFEKKRGIAEINNSHNRAEPHNQSELPAQANVFRQLFLKDKRFLERVKRNVLDSNLISLIQVHAARYFALNKRMPTDSFAYVVHLLPGLVSQESRLDMNARSGAGAHGLAQIMPNTYSELAKYIHKRHIEIPGFTGDYKKDTSSVKTATGLALLHIDRFIYPTIKSSLKDFYQVLQIDPQSEWVAEFSALAALNAYNAGQGTLKQVLRKFVRHLTYMKSHDLGTFQKLANKNPKEFFEYFANTALNGKYHKLYGKDAHDYVLKILAANAVISSFIDKNKALAAAGEGGGLAAMSAMISSDDTLR